MFIITIKATGRNGEKKKEEKKENEIKRNKIKFPTLHTHHRIKKLQMHNSIQTYRKREEKEKDVYGGGGGGGRSRRRRRRRINKMKLHNLVTNHLCREALYTSKYSTCPKSPRAMI